jgi:hypothetical protein
VDGYKLTVWPSSKPPFRGAGYRLETRLAGIGRLLVVIAVVGGMTDKDYPLTFCNPTGNGSTIWGMSPGASGPLTWPRPMAVATGEGGRHHGDQHVSPQGAFAWRQMAKLFLHPNALSSGSNSRSLRWRTRRSRRRLGMEVCKRKAQVTRASVTRLPKEPRRAMQRKWLPLIALPGRAQKPNWTRAWLKVRVDIVCQIAYPSSSVVGGGKSRSRNRRTAKFFQYRCSLLLHLRPHVRSSSSAVVKA